jgi:tetratricopeptide (TPR) repeat protein
MILAFTAAIVGAAPPSTAAVAREMECESRTGPEAAVCLATYYSSAGRFAEAASEFEKAAQLAPASGGGAARDRALAAAGNMWIAAGQPGKAAHALDRALAGSGLQAEQRGEALLDRARAAEAQNDLRTARAKLTEAAQTISADPFLWYFSAAVAIREDDLVTAQTAIAKALALAPSDPTVLFEAGHVAQAAGQFSKAREYWMRAAAGDPNGPVGKSAKHALALLPAPVMTKATPPSK